MKMKSTFKTVVVAALTAIVTMAAYDYFFNEKIEIVENEKTKLTPTTYSFNTNRVAAEMTDFTIAAEKTLFQAGLDIITVREIEKKESVQDLASLSRQMD
jgi:hypothetical protein